MQKGDVLFGKRRAYQRKVGIAPFDGIFSAHGMVLKPNAKVIDASFFPFFIRSDKFMETAMRISVGGLSPTINWKDLAKQEFELPSLEEQKVLAEKLWAAYRLKEGYKKLLAATDEMVKSQFIEMFGNANQPKYEVRKLGDVCEVARGGSPRPIANFVTDDPNGINWIKIGDADGSRYINKTAEKIKSEGVKKSRMVYKGDLILSNSMSFGHPYILNIEGCIHDGWLVLHFDKDIFDPMYLQAYLEQPYTYLLMSNLAAGGVVNNLNSEVVKTLPIIVPSIEIQREYVSILNQADKSKFELKQCIENIDKVIKSLING